MYVTILLEFDVLVCFCCRLLKYFTKVILEIHDDEYTLLLRVTQCQKRQFDGVCDTRGLRVLDVTWQNQIQFLWEELVYRLKWFVFLIFSNFTYIYRKQKCEDAYIDAGCIHVF